MATIRKRGKRWQVQVRRSGHAPRSKSFLKKADAEAWARHQETASEQQLTQPENPSPSPSLRLLIDRYVEEILPLKRSAGAYETIILKAFCRRAASLVDKPASSITASDFGAYRRDRLAKVTGETLRRELGLLQHVFQTARDEWGTSILNPVRELRKPPRGRGRDRRLQPAEKKALLLAARQCWNPLMHPLICLALETGMRRGEMLSIRWRDVDLDDGVVFIRQTKNGHPRRIPLSDAAINLLASLSRTRLAGSNEPVLPISSVAVRQAWDRLLERAKVTDLHFHDLRHEAISAFFELGLSLPEVAVISGHRDPRQLMRYTHLDAARIALKLRKASSAIAGLNDGLVKPDPIGADSHKALNQEHGCEPAANELGSDVGLLLGNTHSSQPLR